MTNAGQYSIIQDDTGYYISHPTVGKYLHHNESGYISRIDAASDQRRLFEIPMAPNDWRYIYPDQGVKFEILLENRRMSDVFFRHRPRLILSKDNKSPALLFDEAKFCKTFGFDFIERISDLWDPKLDGPQPVGWRYLLEYRIKDECRSIKYGLLGSDFLPITLDWDEIILHRCDYADIKEWLAHHVDPAWAKKFKMVNEYNARLNGMADVNRFELKRDENIYLFCDQDKMLSRFAVESAHLKRRLIKSK